MPYLYNIWSFDQEIEFRPFFCRWFQCAVLCAVLACVYLRLCMTHALREGRRGESLGFGVNFSSIWHGIGSWVGYTLIPNQKKNLELQISFFGAQFIPDSKVLQRHILFHADPSLCTKGQLISKANFEVFTKIFLYFCPSLLNGSNHKNNSSLSCQLVIIYQMT